MIFLLQTSGQLLVGAQSLTTPPQAFEDQHQTLHRRLIGWINGQQAIKWLNRIIEGIAFNAQIGKVKLQANPAPLQRFTAYTRPFILAILRQKDTAIELCRLVKQVLLFTRVIRCMRLRDQLLNDIGIDPDLWIRHQHQHFALGQ